MSAHVAAARPAGFGVIAFGLLLAVYFAVLAAVSGWKFTLNQFSEFWYYIVPLGAGFGLQVALYTRLRQLLRQSKDARTVMAASGTTSTAAMISCCAHYLANVAPVLGATGLVTFAAQYQVEFFWVGLAFNAAGIAYIGNKLWSVMKAHSQISIERGTI
jgi:P-type Cu+ transporter